MPTQQSKAGEMLLRKLASMPLDALGTNPSPNVLQGTFGDFSYVPPPPSEMMPKLGSMILDFIPGLGDIKSGQEAIMGQDLITGDKLENWQRWLAGAGALPFIPNMAGMLKKAPLSFDGMVKSAGKNIEGKGGFNEMVEKARTGETDITTAKPGKAEGGKLFYHGSHGGIDRWGISNSQDLGIHFGTKEQAISRVQKGAQGRGTLYTVSIKNIPEEKIIDVPDVFNRVGWPSGSPYADIIRIFDGRINFEWHDKADLIDRARKADDLVDLDIGRGDWNDEKVVRLFWKELRKKLLDYGYEAVRYENKIEGKGESIVILDPKRTKIKTTAHEGIDELPEQPQSTRKPYKPELKILKPYTKYIAYKQGQLPLEFETKDIWDTSGKEQTLIGYRFEEKSPSPSRPPESGKK